MTGTEGIEVESVTDEQGKVRHLQKPISIAISKGPVFVRYSLIYFADVNAKPREVVGTTNILGCASDSSKLLTNPTCGSLYFAGQRVTNSEGFCCQCTLDQMLGMGSHQRGEVQCNLFSGLFGNGASVHCLRWGPLWYSLFKIMTPTIESEISVHSDSGLNLTLRATSPVATARIGDYTTVTARLVGSFGWMRPPTDWGLSMYAASPNVAASNVNDPRVTQSSPIDPFRYGMLVPQSQVDTSGKTCNKIGVSHSAFVNDQGQRCTGRINDCISNQVDDIWSSTKENDRLVNQLCSSIGGEFVRNDGYRLSCRLNDSASDTPSQVLIEMNAEKVLVVYNESIGEIRSVSTSTRLVALVQETDVRIEISNTGDLTSEYIVSVANCTPIITYPLSASRVSLPPNALQVTSVKLEDSRTEGTTYSCFACLTDSEGALLSAKQFVFNTSSVIVDRVSQSSDGTSGNAEGAASASALSVDHDPCSNECSGFFSIMCFLSHTCWGNIGALVGTLGGTGLLMFVLTKFGALSWIWSTCKGLFSCCCGTNHAKRRNSDSGPHRTSDQDIYLQTINHQAWDFRYPQPGQYVYSYQDPYHN